MKSVLMSLVGLAALVYLGLCVLLWLGQRQMLFLSQGTQVAIAQTDFALSREGVTLRGWRIHPGQSRALIYFGGNAESVQLQRERFAGWFPQHTIYLLAYRGYGASEGSPDEAALKADALALYDTVAPEHQQIDVIGRSVGSGVALHLAARRAVAHLALITPYDSLVEVAAQHYSWVPVRLLMSQRFEALPDAARVTAPTLLLIARLDEVIAPARAQVLAKAFAQTPQVQWLDTDHNTVEMDANFPLSLRQFMSEAAPEAISAD